jgi:two-component system OmpR family response regulator
MSTLQILTQVWGYDDYADNLVQVHISALRRKIEAYGPRLIHTARGLGYVLRAPR